MLKEKYYHRYAKPLDVEDNVKGISLESQQSTLDQSLDRGT